MARYTGPAWKISRRLGYSTLESGKEFAIGKNGKERRSYAPGQHGQRRSKLSEFAIQLREKQKVRFSYGLNERQFRRCYDIAKSMKGNTGDNFLILLESRLDNLVYRMGFASTRRQARQLVNHAHFTLDGKKVNIPSQIVKPGQVIAVKEKSRRLQAIQDALASTVIRKEYLSFDENKLEGALERLPMRTEFMEEIQDNLILEFYNR
ncbi:MAG: 30S ribosomal protein S4 [Bacilli bacterium]